ncbi:hypothetical protein BC332_08777 [Capsicum chinense]|nr:hypothetical protein BC332_08777 [Capsicum chinense]
MAQHAYRSSSVRANKSMDLVSDELPSFSLRLTQDEDFNLGFTNIQPKGGVSSEEASSKHRNNSKNKVEKMKRKGLRKPSSPKSQKIQKSMKKRKPNDKAESSKISSLVSSVFEFEEEKVEEEISSFRIPKKVVPAGVSHKDDEVNSDDDFQDPSDPQKYSITQKKYYGDSSTSPVKKKLKQQHKGLDEKTPKRTPPPRVAKKLFARTPIFMPIQPKDKVASKRKDINRSASKKSIPKKDKDNEVDKPPMDKAEKTTPHHESTPKFVHDLYKNSEGTLVTEEIKGNQSASLMEVYNEDKDDVLNTKFVDDNIGEAHISDSQFSFSDEDTRGAAETTVNTSAEDESKNTNDPREMDENKSTKNQFKNKEFDAEKIVNTSEDYQVEMKENKSPQDASKQIDVCFYYLRKKPKYDPNSSYKYNTVDCNFMNIINSVLDVYRIDDASLNAGGKEYHLNEYINEFRMHATVSWHTVDHIFISVNVKSKHNWVLAVISFNDRCIYVYDSLSSAGYDAAVLAEVEKLSEVIPICLVVCKFYEKKGIDIANHPNYKSYDKMDLFDVYIVEDSPQQPSGSLNCGLYMVTYAECLIFGNLVPHVDFDPDMIRTRYASILWDYV